nr:esterase [Planctomycetota bacterium]
MTHYHLVYLHGFGSSPQSAKAAILRDHLASNLVTCTVPELDGGDFPRMTMENYRDRAQAAVDAVPDDGQPLLLAGSSLGGYTAALLAAEGRVARAAAFLLIAPAFGFTERWRDLLGADGIAEWR